MVIFNQNLKSYFRFGMVSFSDDVSSTAWVGKRLTTPLKPSLLWVRGGEEEHYSKTLPSVQYSLGNTPQQWRKVVCNFRFTGTLPKQIVLKPWLLLGCCC